MEEICQQKGALRFRLRLCGSGSGLRVARARCRQACRAQGEVAAGGQTRRQAGGLVCWGGWAGSQRKLGGARSRTRSRRRGARRAHGPRSAGAGRWRRRRRCGVAGGRATAPLTVCLVLRAVKFEGFLLFEVKPSRAKGTPYLARGLFALGVAPAGYSKTGLCGYSHSARTGQRERHARAHVCRDSQFNMCCVSCPKRSK